MNGTGSLARLVGWAGLTAAGVLHAIWASGSPWPMKNTKLLGEVVVGNSDAMPDAKACWIVSGVAIIGGSVAAGGLGEGRLIAGARQLAGAGLLVRAVLGGDVALRALGLPSGGEKFQKLDRGYYRPLFALLGVALILGAKKQRL